jgi:hypothetical protein
MTYNARYADFINDKHNFFSEVNSIAEANAKVDEKKYTFLSDNKTLIEQEFMLLYSYLQEQEDKRQEFWLYCYYCCEMLLAYYEAYGNSAKIKEYTRLKVQITQRCEAPVLPSKKTANDSFIKMLGKKLADDVSDLVQTPLHISKIRSKIGFLNIWRIYWIFLRLTLKQSFLLARDTHLIDKLGDLLGRKIDVDGIISVMDAPADICRVLSVGLFAARFILNAGMVLKHTLVPSKQEKDKPMAQRFVGEIKVRLPDLVNEVWGLVNFCCNFPEFFHLSSAAAGGITIAFLCMDVGIIMYRRHFAEKDYLTKKSQFLSELAYYQTQLSSTDDPTERLKLEEQYKLTMGLLTELEITWKGKNAAYLFNATAAMLLVAGFSASMAIGILFSSVVIASTILVIASYAVCLFGVAMYMSADAFGRYREKTARLEQAKLENQNIKGILAEQQAARREFIFTIVENAIVPGFLLATLAVCPPAGAVFAAMYLLYKLCDSYFTHRANNKRQLSKNPVADSLPEEAEPPANNSACFC